MSLRAAILVVAALAAAFWADRAFNDLAITVFLAQSLLRMTDWLAFWR